MRVKLGNRRIRREDCFVLGMSGFKEAMNKNSFKGKSYLSYFYYGESVLGTPIYFSYNKNKNGIFVSHQVKLGRERYKIRLTSTSCNYGGERFWFVCPLCNKKASCLYFPIKKSNITRFLCRHCLGLSYKSRNVSDGLINTLHRLEDRLEKMRENDRGWQYNNKPTKKRLKYDRLAKKLSYLDDKWLFKSAMRFDPSFKAKFGI